LANDYGNLLNRTLALVNRYFRGQVPARGPEEGGDAALREVALSAAGTVEEFIDRLDFRGALEAIWQILGAANKYLDGEAPWRSLREGEPERAGAILYNTLEAFRIATILLSPWLVTATTRAWEQLGIPAPLAAQRLPDPSRGGGLPRGAAGPAGPPLFPPLSTAPAGAAGSHDA